MAYSEDEDLYYAGISGGTDLAVFDSQFRLVRCLENCGGEGYTKQGMEVTARTFYVCATGATALRFTTKTESF